MCGIAGFYAPGYTPDESGATVETMLEKIRQRGPDARGSFRFDGFNLGHNRLSIIDLAVSANQPLHRGHLSIVFNGEIYNYLEIRETLRAKGLHFDTDSDTEVILAAYEVYGEQCVDHFMGMWAFALLDRRSGRLFCSRDRFGIKPFYYAFSEGGFAFASEPKCLLGLPGVSREVNPAMISQYLRMSWVDGVSETFLRDVHALPAAHNLVLHEGKSEIYRYWDLRPGEPNAAPKSVDEAAERFRELLYQSVSLHSRSDVGFGVCLSGGLDSSSLAALLATQNPEKKTKAFHIYYAGKGEVDERKFARQVAERYPDRLELYTLSPSASDIADCFDDFMQNMGCPVPSSSPYSQYFVMKLAASNGIKVVLDGQGSDEYLAGYRHAAYRVLRDRLLQKGPVAMMREFNAIRRISSLNTKTAATYFYKTLLTTFFSEQQIYDKGYRFGRPAVDSPDWNPVVMGTDRKSSGLFRFSYHQLFQTSLNNLLLYEDRNSMRFSLESRVPFLDHRLVEFASSLPTGYIFNEGWSKLVLRKAISPYVPEGIAYRRDKKGFETPFSWMRGPLKDALLAEPWKFPEGLVNETRAAELKRKYLAGDSSNADMVWRLATLSYWYRNVLPG